MVLVVSEEVLGCLRSSLAVIMVDWKVLHIVLEGFIGFN